MRGVPERHLETTTIVRPRHFRIYTDYVRPSTLLRPSGLCHLSYHILPRRLAFSLSDTTNLPPRPSPPLPPFSSFESILRIELMSWNRDPQKASLSVQGSVILLVKFIFLHQTAGKKTVLDGRWCKNSFKLKAHDSVASCALLSVVSCLPQILLDQENVIPCNPTAFYVYTKLHFCMCRILRYQPVTLPVGHWRKFSV